MKLDKPTIEYVARLAELPITAAEDELFSQQLTSILEYVEKLNSLDTPDVEPTFNVSSNQINFSNKGYLAGGLKKELPDGTFDIQPIIHHIQTSDASDDSNTLTQVEALQNSAKTDNGYFVTSGVFEGD